MMKVRNLWNRFAKANMGEETSNPITDEMISSQFAQILEGLLEAPYQENTLFNQVLFLYDLNFDSKEWSAEAYEDMNKLLENIY